MWIGTHEEKDWEHWDKELEKNIASGKLDFLIEEAVDGEEKRTTARFWKCFEVHNPI